MHRRVTSGVCPDRGPVWFPGCGFFIIKKKMHRRKRRAGPEAVTVSSSI